jgi:hypothetical protein
MCGFLVNHRRRSTFSSLLGAQLDIHSMAASQLGGVEQSSPKAAKAVRPPRAQELDGVGP